MGGAYSTPGGSGSGVGGNGGQPPGGAGRFSDSRSNSASSAQGHSLLDQNSLPWLNQLRSGQLAPSASGGQIGGPQMRGPQPLQVPQLQPPQQSQSGSQPGIEEIIANISRTNPNFLYSLDQLLESYRNQQHQQQQQQSQQHYQSQLLAAAQISQAAATAAAASRSRSPILVHHQQSPQTTGVSRPSSGSLGGLAGQSASGRPGSATSLPFNQSRGSSAGGGVKYGQQSTGQLSEQLAAAAAAAAAAGAYPHLSSSSASGSSLRQPPSSSSYNAIPSSTTTATAVQLHQAYAALGALGSAAGYGENLQELTRGAQSSTGMPPSKRMRLISSSGSSGVPPTAVTPSSSSPYHLQQQQSSSAVASRQQVQAAQQQAAAQEMLNRQLLQTSANNRNAIIAFFSNAAAQQQAQAQAQQQVQVQAQQQAQQAAVALVAAAQSGRASVSSGYYQGGGGGTDAYGQRGVAGGVQRQPGSNLLVSSPNQSSAASSAATASAVAAYNNFAALAVAAQQQQQRYLHPSVSSSSSSTSRAGGGYRGPSQQPTQPQQSGGVYHGAGGHAMPSGGAGSNVLRQQTKEPAYHPQVEAISPAPEEARLLDAVEVKLQREREEMQRRLHDIEARINKEESHLRYLIDRESSLTADLKNETANQPPSGTLHRNKASLSDLEDERAYENPIQALLSETRSRAKRQHDSLTGLCGKYVSASPCALPVYRQPSDLPALQHLQSVYKNGFRRQLIKYIHRRKRAEKARLRILARQYARDAQAFFKRHEKLMNSVKRKQKDVKNREIFEKCFPEIKKIREDQKEKDGSSGKGDDGHDTGSNTGSGADGDQMYDAAEDISKMKEYAIDPPVTLPPWERSYRFICTAHLVIDPKGDHVRAQSLEKWSREDKAHFKERFLATPKNFPAIAAAIDKTVAECIHFYYLTKKTEGYKALVKKHSTSRRRRTGHSDKNGPTGPSHGTSKKAPSRVSTPGGDDHRNSPHLDSKNDDGQSTTHRKSGGGSTRGRSGRRGGSGDHRSTKGSGRGRSGTPVPPPQQQQQQSSSVTASMDQTEIKSTSSIHLESSKATSGNVDGKRQGSTSAVKVEDANQSSNSGKGAADSAAAKPNGSSQSSKVKEEGGNPPQAIQTTSSTLEPRRGFTASPRPPSNTVITDTINLAQSPSLVTFSPHSHVDDPVISRSAFSEASNTGSGIIPPKDSITASVLPAGLPEQLANLTKTGAISPELLASIPQLASSASTQALAQVLAQAQHQVKAVGHDQPTDPTAAAYSKAILIGDFCTAQQLSRGSTPSQQTTLPTTVNMTGTSIQRAADYTDPNYLSNRTIDPSSLPLPAKRMNVMGSTPTSGSRSGLGGGHMRSPPGVGGYHHQQSLPLPPSLMSRHRPMPGQLGSTSIDAPRQPSGMSLSGLSQGGSIYAPQSGGYAGGDTLVATKPSGYHDLTGINPPSKKASINLDSGLATTPSGRPGLDPKIEEYIAHAAKLYQDEVERYTSRDRSDSMRTRTSSETSQQMHAALDNARQRVLRMAAAAVAANDNATNSSSTATATGYSIPSGFADSQLPNEQLGGIGVMEINEMLTKCGPQYLSLIATAAAEASSNQPGGQSATDGPNLFTSRTAPPRQLPPPSLLDNNIPPHQQFTPSNTSASVIPLPRYRKSASGSSTTSVTGGPPVTFSSPPAAATSAVSSIPPQREFFPGLADDSGYHLPPHHHSHHSQQIPPRYPTLMRASATRNLESVGLLPEEIARKNSTSRQQLSQQSTLGTAPISSSLVISSSATPSSTAAAPTSSFRSPESATSTAGTAATNPVSTTSIGTLQETIEKAITDGIIVQRGGQDIPKIDPSTAEAKSVRSMHPSTSLLKPEDDRDTPTSRSPSVGVLTSPTMLVFPKKRSRLPSSCSSAALGTCGVRPASPSRSGGGRDVATPTGSAPSASPALSISEERARASSTSKSPAMVPPSGIAPTSPPSSADSPGNLQIFIPPEEESSQFSPHTEARYSGSLPRQTSNSKSSIGGSGGVISPTHTNEPIAASPRQQNPPSATSPPQQQQQQPQQKTSQPSS